MKKASWIIVRGIRGEHMKVILRRVLDEGEAEAIVLALEVNAGLILLDDREARIQAKSLGLNVTGTLGILLRARRLGLIRNLRPEIEKLKKTGFRISQSLEEEILRLVGES